MALNLRSAGTWRMSPPFGTIAIPKGNLAWRQIPVFCFFGAEWRKCGSRVDSSQLTDPSQQAWKVISHPDRDEGGTGHSPATSCFWSRRPGRPRQAERYSGRTVRGLLGDTLFGVQYTPISRAQQVRQARRANLLPEDISIHFKKEIWRPGFMCRSGACHCGGARERGVSKCRCVARAIHDVPDGQGEIGAEPKKGLDAAVGSITLREYRHETFSALRLNAAGGILSRTRADGRAGFELKIN